MDLNTILREAHSGLRWLIVALTLITLVYLIYGLAARRAFDAVAYRLMLAFSGVITLQWLVGVVFFLVLGMFNVAYQWEHAVTMTVAVGVSHLHMRWNSRRRRDQFTPVARYRNSLIVVLAVLVLVFIGVARLPQGWGI